MKIQLTAKETRKFGVARGLIKSVVEKLPFSAFALESTKSVDSQFTVNPDGSSEFEIHEKSFTAFLEYGSEMFVTVGGIIKTAGLEVVSAFKEFDQGVTDVKSTLLKHDQGFLTQAEIDKATAESHAKMKEELAAARAERNKDKPRIKVVSADSETIPYEVRVVAAQRLVVTTGISSADAAVTFGVKETDIIPT